MTIKVGSMAAGRQRAGAVAESLHLIHRPQEVGREGQIDRHRDRQTQRQTNTEKERWEFLCETPLETGHTLTLNTCIEIHIMIKVQISDTFFILD